MTTQDRRDYQGSHVLEEADQLVSPEESRDPQWYKRAVFYEVLIRGFKDSNGDGTGDIKGLTSQLDYLQWLGVDCIWLLPIYPSPLRDGGYDIADFMRVLPEFGDLSDFVELVDEAHKRGLRVIADLVMNHTSDQHGWFQASRSDPDGPFGDFYVWSDTDQRYPDARIIFVDTETSNWTWDPVRKQYYWHRFFSHQPDLNYDNPQVQEAMLEVLRFWLDLGIDGFRMDAIPYLFERDGTNCENLPETHAYLKRVRAEVDRLYRDRVLLAEANQWPADVVEYFGNHADGGDECHMAFHFPVMPRLFMAVRRESRHPISEVLANTPPIPANCQWGIFLRNHDELTLEMVTDEERDYMYAEYAKDPRMKANVGIRRRLAPLLENDRNQLELFTALLLSLPGSPVLYYGDEIGMGDNIYLGDRDGVRTPMQWNADRNAGFSTADPQRLYLPAILDPVYGYQALNVDQQQRHASSLLNWTRRMISIRKEHPVFGLGGYEELGSSNPSVLAFVRGQDDREQTVLCVNNLSRFPQPVELDLSRFQGCTPVELTGRVRFPRIGELPYLLSLPGHGFYWFGLTAHEELGVVSSLDDLLREWVPRQRWFGGKGRSIGSLTSTDIGGLESDGSHDGAALRVLLVDVSYTDGGAERYQVPLGVHRVPVEGLDTARLGEVSGLGHVYDAPHDAAAASLLLHALGTGADAERLTFRALLAVPVGVRSRVMGAEQSNTSVVYGDEVDEVIVKVFRRVSPGLNPDVELTRALQDAGSPHVAPVHAYVEADVGGEPTTLAVAQRFLPGASEGWAMATASVRDLYALYEELGRVPALEEAGGDFAAESERLGSTTAEVHLALSRALESGRAGADESRRTAERMVERLDEALEVVPQLRPYGGALRRAFEPVAARTQEVPVQRVHGDYHLGQVIRTPEGWVLLDFEGEPARPLAERRRSMSPLRDVAGMLRSYDYAARFLLAERGTEDAALDSLATAWAERNRRAFCEGYAAAAGADPRDEADLLRAFELDKAVYEVVYEARNRPTWLPIPLGSVARLVAGQQ